jgi:phosphohistidine phosphatase SixA
MRKLIIIRQGDESKKQEDGHLSFLGIAQMSRITEKLGSNLTAGRVTILSSTTNAARESAAIVAKALGIDFTSHESLRSDSGHHRDFFETLKLICQYMDEVDILVLVTQNEHAAAFPRFFAKYHLKKDGQLGSYPIGCGCAWIINPERVTMYQIRS